MEHFHDEFFSLMSQTATSTMTDQCPVAASCVNFSLHSPNTAEHDTVTGCKYVFLTLRYDPFGNRTQLISFGASAQKL